MTVPRTPPGLGPRGRALWKSLVADFEIPTHERGLLLEACRTSDQLDALAEVVSEQGAVLPDGRVHPALVESRQLRLVLARLLAALRVPDEPGDADHRPQRRGGARRPYSAGNRP